MGSFRSFQLGRASGPSDGGGGGQGSQRSGAGRSGQPGGPSQPATWGEDLPRLPDATLRPPNRPRYTASEGGLLWGAGPQSGPGAVPAPGATSGALPATGAPEQIAPPSLMPWNTPAAPAPTGGPAFTAPAPAPGRVGASAPIAPLVTPPVAPSAGAPPFDSSPGGAAPSLESLESGDPQATAVRSRVASGAPEAGRRPSLTTEMRAAQARAVQPPDVARQAISELGVLAGELSALAGELESSGLARIHGAAYFDLLARYAALSRTSWLSVAAERLEQDGASAEYRQRAIGVARDISKLRRECEVVTSNTDFTLPRRAPWRWRRRSRMATRALRLWQSSLTTPADPQRMGIALYDLRGALHTALTPGLELTLLDTLSGAARWLVAALAVASGLSLAGSALADQPEAAAGYAVLTLMTLIGWLAFLLLLSRTLGALPETLAGASFSETHSGLNGYQGSRFAAGALRAWWVFAGMVGCLATLVALALGALFMVQSTLARSLVADVQAGGLAALASLTPAAWLLDLGNLLATLLTPATLMASLAAVAVALPVLLVSVWRFMGELGGWRRWSPGARRYALGPALGVIAWPVGAALGLAWALSARVGLDGMVLARFTVANTPLVFSARAIALALTLALAWILLIEAPFRVGLGRWRRAWLRDLTTRKTATESHVRRLSAPDPHTGAQDTSEETLRMMQYDLVLLQFYTARIEEAERASASPLSATAVFALLIFILAAALLLDAGSGALVHALQGAIGL